jgi:hypothetical protein
MIGDVGKIAVFSTMTSGRDSLAFELQPPKSVAHGQDRAILRRTVRAKRDRCSIIELIGCRVSSVV